MKIINVTPENVLEHTLFCVKDVKNPGFLNKQKWFGQTYREGLRIKILKDHQDKPIAFIEYVPGENAWRPVEADNYMFIHCMFVYYNKDKNKGNGSMLIRTCEEDATANKMLGLAVLTSKGSFIADQRLFKKNGFIEVQRKDRFELMVKKFNAGSPHPKLIDWTANREKFKGWHLVYADQCPWHEKSVTDLKAAAEEFGVKLNVKKITTVKEAKSAPSGFGVFSLLHNGKLLEDHYISQTRFKNILRKELKI